LLRRDGPRAELSGLESHPGDEPESVESWQEAAPGTVLWHQQFYRGKVCGVSLGIPGEDGHPLHRGMGSNIEIR
jgi:hypothetical protein